MKRSKAVLYDLESTTAEQLPLLRLIYAIEDEHASRERLAAALRCVGVVDEGKVESVRRCLMDGELAREDWAKLQAPAAALVRRFRANSSLLTRSIGRPSRRLSEPSPCAPLCLNVLSLLRSASQLRPGVEEDVARFDAAVSAVCSRSAVFDDNTGRVLVAASTLPAAQA